MTKKIGVLLFLCCFSMVSCSNSESRYVNEVKSKTVEARAGQDFSRHAVYNPEMSADAAITSEDAKYAAGAFILTDPSTDKLKTLSGIDNVALYYNKSGQVIIEIKGR